MITKYTDYCLICGKPCPEVHHLVFGVSKRNIADIDGLTMPLCREHHEQMHNHKGMMAMSRICGQLYYEKCMCAAGMNPDEARESFRKRYGESYM